MFGTFLVPGIFPWNFRIFFGPLEIGPLLNFPVVSENMTQCLCIRILDHVQRFYQILTPAEHTALRHTGFGAEFVQCFFQSLVQSHVPKHPKIHVQQPLWDRWGLF